MTTFKRTNSADEDFKKLVALLDAGLRELDGEAHAFYAQFNKLIDIQTVIVCYVDDVPIACGAFKEYSSQQVEIKRMFVLPQNRGQGTGHLVLKELEVWAAALHYKTCILETGKRQPDAISLYKKAGYHIIENFGSYKEDENSVCMAKDIF